jgi:hypothetical protein
MCSHEICSEKKRKRNNICGGGKETLLHNNDKSNMKSGKKTRIEKKSSSIARLYSLSPLFHDKNLYFSEREERKQFIFKFMRKCARARSSD